MGKLSPQEFKSMKEMFDLYDKDKNGKISETELRKLLSVTGENPTTKEVADLMKTYGCKGDITLAKFTEMWADFSSRKTNTKDLLRKSFKVFDKNGDEMISVRELKVVLQTLGEKMTDAELAEMFQSVDANKDGKIEINEFVNFFNKPTGKPTKKKTPNKSVKKKT